jgi:hypothetical protein
MPCEERAEDTWPKAIQVCLTCNDGEVEDVKYPIMQCLSDESLHRSMLVDMRTVIDRRSNAVNSASFDAMSQADQCES